MLLIFFSSILIKVKELIWFFVCVYGLCGGGGERVVVVDEGKFFYGSTTCD